STGRCAGNCKVKAGSMLELKALGEKFSGKYFVTSVKHKFVPLVGFETFFFVEKNTGVMKTSGGAVVGSGAGTGPVEKKQEERGTIKKNPNLKNLKWLDKDGKEISEAMIGDMVTMQAEVEEIDDGKYVKLTIYEKDYEGDNDYIRSNTVKIKDGKIEKELKVPYIEDTDDVNSKQELEEKGYTTPEFMFVIKYEGATGKSWRSQVLEIKDWIEIEACDSNGNLLKNVKYTIKLADGSEKKGTTDANGIIKIEGILIGIHDIILEKYKFLRKDKKSR
ncbi:MAG: hypothetical protein GY754_33855, partial [bacterium]|nr:hypothetical protein [bacterium]